MVKNNIFYQTKQYRKLIIGSILPIALMILLVQVLSAQQAPIAEANIEVAKAVDKSLVKPGDTVEYTISMNNTGDASASDVVMTDTVPVILAVNSSSFLVQGKPGNLESDGNVITWTGTLDPNESVAVSFDAVVTDTAPFEPITNTVYVTGTGSLLSSSAVLTVTDNITYTMFMPIVSKAPPSPVLLSVSQPIATSEFYDEFEFVVNWSDVAEAPGGRYELQESQSSDFANPTNYEVDSATSKTVAHSISRYNEYYYRVRYITSNDFYSGWSNTIKQYGPYIDDFSDDTSGWSIRREDLDDTENYAYYEDDQLRLKLEGRWDFAIASSMKVVPWDSYRIKTQVRFDSTVDNLHVYGIIWGGDWDGQTPCPNEGFTSCLNHYYRINMMWYGDNNDLRIKVKRINYHDKDGIGRGTTIFDWENVKVNDPSGGWQIWTVEQNANGDINIYINGRLFIEENDPNYAGAGNYFGVMAASNEYLGTNPYFDWISVTPLP